MEEYQIVKLYKFRERVVFSFCCFILIGGILEYSGVWCGYVRIREQKIKERYLEFDDGWSYMHYWGGWKYKWNLNKIL